MARDIVDVDGPRWLTPRRPGSDRRERGRDGDGAGRESRPYCGSCDIPIFAGVMELACRVAVRPRGGPVSGRKCWTVEGGGGLQRRHRGQRRLSPGRGLVRGPAQLSLSHPDRTCCLHGPIRDSLPLCLWFLVSLVSGGARRWAPAGPRGPGRPGVATADPGRGRIRIEMPPFSPVRRCNGVARGGPGRFSPGEATGRPRERGRRAALLERRAVPPDLEADRPGAIRSEAPRPVGGGSVLPGDGTARHAADYHGAALSSPAEKRPRPPSAGRGC